MIAPDGDDYTWREPLCFTGAGFEGLTGLAARDQAAPDVRTLSKVDEQRLDDIEARLGQIGQALATLRQVIEQLFEVRLP